jgi:hypothetical protein
MTGAPASTIVCDVRTVIPEVAAVDALARLQLNAQRLGLELRLRHASAALRELIAFAGLDEVLRVEAQGQAEEREERLGVEEERELDDPAGL